MKSPAFAPIRYNRRQVALMVTVALYFNPAFASQSGENTTRMALVTAGIIPPPPAILEAFNLQKDGSGYVWNPR